MTVPLELSQGRSREGNGHLRFGVLGMSVGHVEGEGGRGVSIGQGHRHGRTVYARTFAPRRVHAPSCESTTQRAYDGYVRGIGV